MKPQICEQSVHRDEHRRAAGRYYIAKLQRPMWLCRSCADFAEEMNEHIEVISEMEEGRVTHP